MADGVPWRRTWAVVGAVAVAAVGVVVAVRADGFAAVDATVPRATRWFVDRDSGRLMLADGFSGKPLARIQVAESGFGLEVAQSASGVALVDRTDAQVRSIDSSALRLGPQQPVSVLAEPNAVVGFGQTGLIAVDPDTSDAVLVPPDGEGVPFQLDHSVDGDTLISPDGALWSIADGALVRATTNGTDEVITGLSSARFSLVGNEALVFDTDRGRVRFGDGGWHDVPADLPVSEFVLQEPGPAGDCGWIAANDTMLCVGTGGIDHQVDIGGLGINGNDRLAIGGDAGVVVRPGTGRIDRVDWRAGELLGADAELLSPQPGAELAVSASVDLVWIDDVEGDSVWAVHPWGISSIPKNDDGTPLLADTGDVLDQGQAGGDEGEEEVGADEVDDAAIDRKPDTNDIDDPPVANDDQVTSRFGSGVPIVVTANDYDPDGEAVAVSSVGDAESGVVTITSATTVLYSPDVDVVGTDTFEYTIVDGNGTEATATVTVALLPADAANRAPIGSADRIQTRVDTPVVIDVLLNDIDPERDQLRVGDYKVPPERGTVTDTEGPSGLPALEYSPPAGFSGVVSFTYRPLDSLGAAGDDVRVTVDIAGSDEANRPPIGRPDALRVRRNEVTSLPVLANDRDPDGDQLILDVPQASLPAGLEVEPSGSDLEIVVRPGSASLLPFQYTITDGPTEPVPVWVLVSVIADSEPNRPPVANADTETAVVGQSTLLDVLANDRDPDGDSFALVSFDQPDDGTAIGTVTIRGDQIEYLAGRVDAEDAVFDRFTYTIDDGHGNTGVGEVTVRVLPEPVKAPPFARDDAATTPINQPVTIDVLRNDGDPSGEQPTLLGVPNCPSGGTAEVTSDSKVTYTPSPGRTGPFTCTYQVLNSQRLTASATILINVLPEQTTNRPPVVVDLTRTVVVNSSIPIDLLAGASDPDDDELTITSIATPTAGRFERDDATTITYFAPAQAQIVDLSFFVTDDAGGTTTGHVLIRVQDAAVEPAPPVARADAKGVIEDYSPQVFAVLDNDLDADGDVALLRVTDVAPIQNGTMTWDARSVTITPPADFLGTIETTYEVTDAQGETDEGTVTLTVSPRQNDAPVARDDAASVVNGGSVVVALALNDEDIDGDALTYRLVSGATSDLGTATLDGSSLRFVATPGESGVAAIAYSVTDGRLSATATARITVLACAAAPPEAPDVALATGYMTPIAIDLRTYAKNGEVTEIGAPLGAVAGTYQPPAGENGNVSFSYTVRNACNLRDTGVVTIDVNQDPLPATVARDLGRNATLSIPVADLGSDAEPLVIQGLENAPDWVTVAADGASLSVTPNGRAGRADLVAVIADPGGLTARAAVAINLVNLAPVANADTFQGDNGALIMDVLANDADPDVLDTISLQLVPASVAFTNGVTVPIETLGGDRLRINPNGASGTGTFAYTIADSQGLVSEPATVTITLNSPPIAPTENITVITDGTPQVFPVRATDPDNQPLTLTVLDSVPQLEITVDGLNVTIVAGESARNNSFPLRYRVTDPLGASTEGVLNIAGVAPTTTTLAPPTAPPVVVTMTSNSATTVTVDAKDTNQGTLLLALVDDPAPLGVSIDGLAITIVAPRGTGGEQFVWTYSITNTTTGLTSTNTITVDVQRRNP